MATLTKPSTTFREGERTRSHRVELERQLGITKAITEHALEALFMLDAHGRTTFVNPAGEAMFGFSAAELMGKVLHDQIHHHRPNGEPFPLSDCPVGQVFATGRPIVGHEDVFFRKDGSQVHVACSNAPIMLGGRVVAAVMAVSDITRRKLAERALLDQETRLASALEIARLGVWSYDLNTELGEFDSRCREVLGLPAEGKVSSKDLLDRIHPRDRSHLESLVEEAARFGANGWFESEHRVVRPDGSCRWVAVRGRGTPSTLQGDHGFDRFVGTLMDITELKEAEQRIRNLNDTLEQRVQERTAELLASNSDLEGLTHSVAHDLRAPLRAINATSRILERELGDSLTPDQRQMIERQVFNSSKLAQLIDDLLRTAKIGRQNMEREAVSLTTIARDVAAAYETFPGRIVVQRGLRAHGDPKLLRFLLENLIDNACKYSPDGGTVRVGKRLEGRETVFFVSDQGIGFEMRFVDRIFHPFERLHRDNEYPGTGIGLANVRRIVERHNGRIWAESEPGAGSTFYFTLGASV